MANNSTIVKLADGREVCLSYGVPVAAFIPGRGYVRTDRRYSVTTSKHANAYTERVGAILEDAEFRALIAPVA
jgi:hypothetical protein